MFLAIFVQGPENFRAGQISRQVPLRWRSQKLYHDLIQGTAEIVNG
jgi:hypothetical protein